MDRGEFFEGDRLNGLDREGLKQRRGDIQIIFQNAYASMNPLFAALLPFSPFSAFSARADIEIGQPAPDFSFQGSDGKAYSLSSLLEAGTGGIVLAFFPKAFTPG